MFHSMEMFLASKLSAEQERKTLGLSLNGEIFNISPPPTLHLSLI